MPTSAATARAAAALSPVSSTGCRPSPRSCATASAEVGLTVSATTSTARAAPSQATATAVRPCRSAAAWTAASSGGSGWLHCCSSAARPTSTACPSTMPLHARAPPRWRSPSTAGSGADPIPGAAGDRRGDRVLGGVLERRRPAAAPRPRRRPSAACTATSAICPVVTVPVLSSTTVSTRRVDSSTSGPLMRMPELGAAAGADQQRGGRGQPQRARAGDDQHGDGGGERRGRARRRCRARTRGWPRPAR